jgi:hypothetical protein
MEIKPSIRNAICTVNIITYITDILTILLKNKTFFRKIDAVAYIHITSEKILESGEHFIPNWDIVPKIIV